MPEAREANITSTFTYLMGCFAIRMVYDILVRVKSIFHVVLHVRIIVYTPKASRTIRHLFGASESYDYNRSKANVCFNVNNYKIRHMIVNLCCFRPYVRQLGIH